MKLKKLFYTTFAFVIVACLYSCGPSAKEKAVIEKAKNDSINKATQSESFLGYWKDTKYGQPSTFSVSKIGNDFQINDSQGGSGIKNGTYKLTEEGTLIGMGTTLSYDKVNNQLISSGNGYERLNFTKFNK